MNFNTLEFIFFFLPATLIIFYLSPPRFRLIVLCVASIVFYGAAGLVPLYFLLATVIWGFVTALIFGRGEQPYWIKLAVSISFPLLVLFLFKYLNFTLASFGASPAMYGYFYIILSIVLPAGISFYTFTMVSYSVDVLSKEVPPERSFLKLLTYMLYFPHLIAGPILRYTDLNAQLQRVSKERVLHPDFPTGLKYFSYGLFGKIFFSDFNQAIRSRFILASNDSSIDAFYSVLAYSFQIYFDFWAYSLMAMGISLLFAIKLPKNFDEPYISKNPREFWRRWHITLSMWLRDYVYIKLGGNRAYVRNIVIVFAVCGLWHGAGWNFVVWGLYHAALVVLYHFTKRWWDPLPIPVQIAMTFSLVTFGWPLFYSDLNQYILLMKTVFSFNFATPSLFGPVHWVYLAAIAAITFFFREGYWLYNTTYRRIFDTPFVHAVLCFAAIVFFGYRSTFIYFRF